FHLMFWGSRTLPNCLALVLVNWAMACWINGFKPLTEEEKKEKAATLRRTIGGPPRSFTTGSRSASGKVMKGDPVNKKGSTADLDSIGLILFGALATLVFRLEVAALFAPVLLSDLLYGRRSIIKTLLIGVLSSAFAIGLTISVDSYFWRKPWLWPELEVFRFNILENRSVEYGVSPFHAFLTSLIPRIAPVSYPLSFYASYVDKRVRRILLPPLLFVLAMSVVPHKEWRFVIYVVPLLNIAAATAFTRLTRLARRKKGLAVHKLFFIMCLGGLFASILASQFMLAVSTTNYPGGMALYHLHRFAWPHPKQTTTPKVHIDALAASTGITQFGYLGEGRGWEYDKDETLKSPREYVETGYTHLLTGNPEFHLMNHSDHWDVIGAAKGFHSIDIYDGKGLSFWATEAFRNISTVDLLWYPSRGYYGIKQPIQVITKPKVYILQRKDYRQ
ncbi:hypothetical protein HDU67_004161, partial [Dinochytrium kinnereticum]